MPVQRLGEALRLRRDAFLWMVTASRASGDAVVVVVAVFGLWFLLLRTKLGAFAQVEVFFLGVISFLVAWVIATAAYWAAGRFWLKGSGQFWSALPVVGFAHAPLALVPIGVSLGIRPVGLSLLAAAAWSGMMLAAGARVALDLEREKTVLAAIAAVVGWWIGFRYL